VAGLAARGAPAVRAAVWGAYLHGAAGRVLARRLGPIGFLARELLDEVPGLLRRRR
jgi:ADP-dependent NAD(P)H-hydrate dehydratase